MPDALDDAIATIDDILTEVTKADRISTLTGELQDLLLVNWEAANREAIADALRTLSSLPGKATKKDIALVITNLEDRLGVTLGEAIKRELYDLSDRIYAKGKQEVINQVGAKLSFGVVDRKAIQSISRQSVFWVGNYWNQELSDDIKTTLQDALSAGLSRDEVAQVLSDKFGEIVDRGKNYFKGFTNHVVTRARELGHTEAYVNAGVKYLEVRAILDGRTTEICLRMHGRHIPVENAVTLRDKLINAKDPEDVKSIAPWVQGDSIKGKRTDKLSVGLSLPPYHFNCRTTTVAVFEDEGDEPERLNEKEIAAEMEQE